MAGVCGVSGILMEDETTVTWATLTLIGRDDRAKVTVGEIIDDDDNDGSDGDLRLLPSMCR